MGIGYHSEKSFIWDDVQLSTTFSFNQASSSNAIPLHSHSSHYEMFIIDSGTMLCYDENATLKFTKNTAIIIPPNVNHKLFPADMAQPPKIMYVAFSFKSTPKHNSAQDGKLFNYFNSLIGTKDQIVVLKDKFFSDFCHRFLSESESDPTLASFLITNLIEELFLRILRLLKVSHKTDSEAPIYSYKTSAITNDLIIAKNIEDYMNMPGCTLTVLAKKLNMCPRNTQKIIKRIFGQSFSEKMASARLKQAVYLIENTDLSFTEIAKRIHYNQYASFRKAFIAHYGMSPSEYREKAGHEN